MNYCDMLDEHDATGVFLVLFCFVENSSAYSFKGNGLVYIEIAPTYMSSGLTDGPLIDSRFW